MIKELEYYFAFEDLKRDYTETVELLRNIILDTQKTIESSIAEGIEVPEKDIENIKKASKLLEALKEA